MQFWWDEERECNSCKCKCLKEFLLCLKGKYAEKDTYYVFNHLEIKMFYHQPSDAEWDATLGSVGGRIVSAKVIPRRYSHSVPSQPCIVGLNKGKTISYLHVHGNAIVWKNSFVLFWQINHTVFVKISIDCKFASIYQVGAFKHKIDSCPKVCYFSTEILIL